MTSGPANTETSIDPKADLFPFLTVDMPTAIPRFNLVAQVGWSPTADRSSNPFAGYTAAQLGAENIAANELEIELGGTVALIRPQDTKGGSGLPIGNYLRNVDDDYCRGWPAVESAVGTPWPVRALSPWN